LFNRDGNPIAIPITNFPEAEMSRMIYFDKESKRRIRRIRWTPIEKTTATVLFVILGVLSILFGLWYASHYSDPFHASQLRLRR
jgi:hypothetical protein